MNQIFDIFDSIIDQIAIINKDGLVVYTNKAWEDFSKNNSGNPTTSGPGINYLDVCDRTTGDDLGTATEASVGIRKVILREQMIFEQEYPCHTLEEKRWFIMRVNPLKKYPDFTMISHINITKRKIAEEENERHSHQLKAVNERLNTTLLKIVHDIQSPLTSIEGLVDLSKTRDEIETFNPYFAMIETSIVNLKNYIQETLNYFSSGILIEPLQFKNLLEDFLGSVKYAEAMKFIKINTNVHQETVFYSDKAEISLIIANIVSNAIKYYDKTKEENFIDISIDVNEKEATLCFRDNGIGIETALHSKIFDLSFQVDKLNSSGSGIGLHLVRNSVHSIGGTIHVNSTLGVSTEFIVFIPNIKI